MHRVLIALAAFLVFAIQPIAARILLPWFGGSASVWSTSLVFFQAALLVGYAYVDWTDRRMTPARQSKLHLVLLGLSVVSLPVAWFGVPFLFDQASDGDPALRILVLLTATIGLPYALLSTTAPLVQSWYRNTPSLHRLYALSNAGSMLALISYPVLIEPMLSRRAQVVAWITGYVAYAAICAILARRRAQSVNLSADEPVPQSEDPRPGFWARVHWIVLSAYASALLVSTTSHVSQDVAPAPFLWVLPLSLYLLSFIICFGAERVYIRWIWIPLTAASIGAMLFFRYTPHDVPLWILLLVYNAGLFVCCIFCQGELVRSRPIARNLPAFYLAIALGGAIGSSLTTLVAPRMLSSLSELPITLAIGPLLIAHVLFAVVRSLVPSIIRQALRLFPVVAGATFAIVFVARHIRDDQLGARLAVRNFYGALRVYDHVDENSVRSRELRHGVITHGAQLLDEGRRCEPITYYTHNTGLGAYFDGENRPAGAHIGVMGLGTGSVAGYGRPGDRMTFYEINPLVPMVAQSEFSYLRGCGADTEVIMGDARQSLQREPAESFDLIVMDAFSGDAIPVHLMTREAFELYFQLLRPTGVIAIHISNRYLNLEPVAVGVAHALDKDLRVIKSLGFGLQYASTWVLLANYGVLKEQQTVEAATPGPLAPSVLWTDDFSSLWKVIKWKD